MADEIRIRELAAGETHLAHRAMLALRPAIGDEPQFATHVDQVQRPEGYRLVAAFEPPEQQALSVAGFRVGHNLPYGSYLYVDDLSTHPDGRRRGLGGRLLDWLVEETRRLECDQLHLDSGVGPTRSDAHRLYLNRGLTITSHHFARDLRQEP